MECGGGGPVRERPRRRPPPPSDGTAAGVDRSRATPASLRRPRPPPERADTQGASRRARDGPSPPAPRSAGRDHAESTMASPRDWPRRGRPDRPETTSDVADGRPRQCESDDPGHAGDHDQPQPPTRVETEGREQCRTADDRRGLGMEPRAHQPSEDRARRMTTPRIPASPAPGPPHGPPRPRQRRGRPRQRHQQPGHQVGCAGPGNATGRRGRPAKAHHPEKEKKGPEPGQLELPAGHDRRAAFGSMQPHRQHHRRPQTRLSVRHQR